MSVFDAPRVAPSILAADFARLRECVDEVLAAGARVIHVDVMDGHFVPPITMGPLAVSALRETTAAAGALLDVHLMIEHPERQIGEFARAGADNITVHAEATPHVNYVLAAIREAGCTAGLAVCPSTSPAIYAEVADLVDVALCMTVNPGWGGQPFIAGALDKVSRIGALLEAPIEVDGGVDDTTAPRCREAGASLFVAGTAIFGAADPAAAYAELADAVGDPRR